MFRLLLSFLVIGGVSLFGVKSSFSLQITPLRTMMQADAGQEINGSITLVNDKRVPVNVEISLQDNSDTGEAETDWLSLHQDVIFVEAKQSSSLEYAVSIPKTASGEYYARIAFLEKPANAKEANVAILTKISVPFIVSVKGTEIYDYEIVDFHVGSDSVDLTVHNKGNVHIRPFGNCYISSLENKKLIQTVKLNHDSRAVLPGVEQQFKVRLKEELVSGQYVGELQVALSPQSKNFISKSFEFEVNEAL